MTYKEMLEKFRELEDRLRALESQHIKFGPGFIPDTRSWPQGCSVCGLGSDGKSYGYVCNRTDCPTAITCNIQDVFK